MSRQTTADHQFVVQALRSAKILRDGDDSDLAELARLAKPVAVKAGADLSDTAFDVVVIRQGVVAALRRLQAGGRGALTLLLGAGDLAGAEQVFKNGSNLHDKREGEASPEALNALPALTNVAGYGFSSTDVSRIMRRNPALMDAALCNVADRLNETQTFIAETIFRPVELRLAAFFSRLATLAAPDDWDPTVQLGHIAQSTIADMLGVSREHINRTLTMWERSGLVFLNRSGTITINNRKRLAALAAHERERSPSPGGDDWLAEIDAHLDCGLNDTAFHLAIGSAKRSPKDKRVRHRAVLATARSGGAQKALDTFDELKLGEAGDDEDIACLRPRLLRDLAFTATAPAQKNRFLKQSADGYRAAFETCQGYYSGVNAAAGLSFLGEKEKAAAIVKDVARRIEQRIERYEEDAGDFFLLASLAECALLAGDTQNAATIFGRACNARDVTAGKKATTRKQLRRLAPNVGIDDAWIDRAMPQEKVLFFAGPLDRDGDQADALATLKEKASAFIRSTPIERAFGALACGADIVIAETLLDAGVDLDIYLPLAPRDFLRHSVAVGGDGWRERFITCMSRANAIDWNRRAGRPTRAFFLLGAYAAMASAIRHARQLETEAVGLFAAPHDANAAQSMSVACLDAWRAADAPAEEIRDDWRSASAGATPPPSQSPDGDDIVFCLTVAHENSGKAKAPSIPGAILTRADPEQGVFMGFFQSANKALDAAQTLARKKAAASRLWLDAGAVSAKEMEKSDDETLRRLFLTTTCLPNTPPGQIFASELFVSAAQFAQTKPHRFEYAGFSPTREKLEPCPLYTVAE